MLSDDGWVCWNGKLEKRKEISRSHRLWFLSYVSQMQRKINRICFSNGFLSLFFPGEVLVWANSAQDFHRIIWSCFVYDFLFVCRYFLRFHSHPNLFFFWFILLLLVYATEKNCPLKKHSTIFNGRKIKVAYIFA